MIQNPKYVCCSWLATLMILLSSCTGGRMLADGPPASDKYPGRKEKKNLAPVVLMRPGYTTYFVILDDAIYQIAVLPSAGPALQICRAGSAASLRKIISAVRNAQQRAGDFAEGHDAISLQQLFKPLVLPDEGELALQLNTLRQLSLGDRNERGSFLRISEEPQRFRLYLESSIIVGHLNEVSFTFPVNSTGNLSHLDKNGDLLIGTVHTHSHDKGLSGFTFNPQADEKGDISNIKTTGIPWVAIGPASIEGGYLNAYGEVITEDVGSVNLALYALFRVAMDLRRK